MKRSMPVLRHLLAIALLLTLTPLATAESRSMENADGSYNLTSWDAHGGEQIGYSVALHERMALLGAPSGGWFGQGDVLVCSQLAGEPWSQIAWLSSFMAELEYGAQFGKCVAVHPNYSGILLAVGAPGINKVFIFHSSGSGLDWNLLAEIQGEPDSAFGSSIAMQEQLIAIGAPQDESGRGSVTVFVLDGMRHGGSVEYLAKGYGSIYKDTQGEFGSSVAMFGGATVLVGSPGNSPTDGGGMVSAHALPGSSADPWNDAFWSAENGGSSLARFGSALAMFDGRLAIGVPGPYDADDSSSQGRVELYHYDSDSQEFQYHSSIETDLPSPEDQCGYSLHMFEDLLSVGVPGANVAGDSSGIGMVYRFSPNADAWRRWSTIVPGGGQAGDQFGYATAINGTGVVFASPYMSAFASGTGLGLMYEMPSGIDGEWQRDTRSPVPVIAERGVINSPDPERGTTTEFGRGLAAAGDHALVGDPGNGVIYAYSRTGTGAAWSEVHALPMPPGDVPEDFGAYIEMVDDLAIVGSPAAGSGGEAYVYERDGATWSLMQVMTPMLTTLGFGESLAIERADDGSTWCAVGDPSIGQNQLVSGSVHLYRQGNNGTFALTDLLLDTEYVSGADSQFGHALDFGPAPSEPLLLAVGDPVDEVYGAVSIFECDSSGATMQQMLVGDGHYYLFGTSVVIDDEYCIVGSMPDESQGEVAVHTRSIGFRDDEHGGGGGDGGGGSGNQYTFTWTLSYPSGRLYDHFGADMVLSDSPRRLLISAPGIDYSGLNAGAVLSYVKGDDPPNEWALDAMMFTPQAVDGESLGELALTEETVLLGRSDFGSSGSQVFGRVYDFPLGNSVSWTNQQGGSIDGAWNWSADPEQSGATTGLFSLLVGDSYDVQIGWQWQGSLEVMFDTIGLESTGSPAQVLGDLKISSPATLKTAEVVLDGWLQVDDDVLIGPQEDTFYDEAGKLIIATTGMIETLDRFEMSTGAALTIMLDPLTARSVRDDPIEDELVPVRAAAVELGGSLEVSIEAIADGATLELGDQFTLMESTSGPFESSLDLMLLPGIPGGELAFVVTIESNLRGGSGQSMVATVVDLAGLLDFGDPNSVAVTGEPTDVEVVDLTGDGAEEICVIFADSPGTLAIFENDGSGGITQQILVDTGDLPIDITSGDFDGDGHEDLAIANYLSSDVLILYNDDEDLSDGFEDDDSDGNPGTDLDVASAPTCVASIDFDSDSNRDLIVGMDVGDGTGLLQIYLGATQRGADRMPPGGSKSTPRPPKYIDPSEEEDQKAAYMFTVAQEDGQTSAGGGASALRGGTGGIVLTNYTTGVDPGGMTTGDFNGDGLGDVAVTSITNGTVAILRQDAANPGEFLSAIYVSLGSEPSRIAAVDFDEDGNVDLAAITYDGNDDRVVRILQNDGNMAFTSVDTAVGENVALIDAGDVSGDGSSELVTISGGASLRGDDSVLLSLRELDSAVFCDGDVDASGEVDVLDLLEVLSNWDCAGSKCIGDANGDDVVDVLDLLMVIGNWGICG